MCACNCMPCTCCEDTSCATEFTDPTAEMCALIPSLTGVVDSIRDLYTCLGARPYSVALVWARWSGGQRNIGNEEVVAVRKLLPTPLISTLNALALDPQQIGVMELGEIRVSQLSPRFSEDLLNGQDVVVPAGEPLPEDVNFYWQVTFVPSGVTRRFTGSTPNFDPLKFEWTMPLTRQYDDAPRGTP